ncbi:MAG: hypothetical protein IAE79_23240 [Anaerolinea sp.]|nr:hypothetical protein [Anaerolinea sp.]
MARSGAPESLSPEDYTNGISAHNAHRWTVSDNEWRRIRTPNQVPAPAILFWSGSSDTLVERNLLVAALADEVLIAYAHPGSSTEQLAREVLNWGKPIHTLPNDRNENLRQQGVLDLSEL